VWSERYDREMQDIFDVQDEITLAVVDTLKLRLLGTKTIPALKRGTDNPEAYELYLKGRFCWNKRTGGALQQPVEFYERAIARDPGYALAHAGLAECYALFSWLSVTSPHTTMPRARAAALRALEIDESLAEAHAALGACLSFYAWDQPASERALRRAIEVNPSHATAHHWLGNIPLLAQGRFDESIAAIKRARARAPLTHHRLRPGRQPSLRATLRRGHRAVPTRVDSRFEVLRGSVPPRCDLPRHGHARSRHRRIRGGPPGGRRPMGDRTPRPCLRRVRTTRRGEERSRPPGVGGGAAVRPERRSRGGPCGTRGARRGVLLAREGPRRAVAVPPFYAVDPVFDDVCHDPRFRDLVRRVEGARFD